MRKTKQESRYGNKINRDQPYYEHLGNESIHATISMLQAGSFIIIGRLPSD
jgi:hypothetical protein